MEKLCRGLFPALLGALCLLCACKSVSPQEKVRDEMTESRALVRQHIADPAKAKELLALVDATEEQLKAYRDERRELGETLIRMNADYNASREDMQKLYDDYNRRMREIEEKLLQLQLDFRARVTSEEWALVN